MWSYNQKYYDYLESDDWFMIREAKLKSVDYKCEICGSVATQCHHINYVNLYNEDNDDLQALCWQCHKYRALK